MQTRRMVDLDNPTLEGLQTLLLLSQTFFAYGLGKKAYMTFCMCSPLLHRFWLLTLPSQLCRYGGRPGLVARDSIQSQSTSARARNEAPALLDRVPYGPLHNLRISPPLPHR